MYDVKVLVLKPTLRTEEAAAMLDVTPRTVRRYLIDAKLTGIRTPGGQYRVVNDEKLKRYF